MAKTTLDNHNYRTHNRLFVPENMWNELHPVRAGIDSVVRAAPKVIAGTVVAGTIAMALAGAPDMARAEEPAKDLTPQHEVFAGTLVDEAGIDTIATYEHSSGLITNLELFDRIWTPKDALGGNPAHAIDFGIRSPKFLDDRLRGNATVSTSIVDTNDWIYTAFLEAFPTEGLTLRAGGLHDGVRNKGGGFLGGKLALDFLTLDLDTWYDGDKNDNIVGLHGFVAGAIPTSAGTLYLSAGGNLDSEVINTLTGWINPGKLGIFNKVSIDLANETQKGLLLIADQSTYTKGKFDFKQHVYNATQMRSHGTQILDGWPPFIANYTTNVALAGSWHNSPNEAGFDAMAYFVPTEGVFLGIGAGDKIIKAVDRHEPFARAELYAKIAGPLEAWADLPIDLNTGKMKPTLYIGGSGSF